MEMAMKMSDLPWYRDTLALARRLHAGQVDKVGQPKVEHVERVARRLVELFPDATADQVQAALLHDTLEDCDTTPVRLVLDGIEPEVVELVERLTHQPGVPYLDYIRALAASGDIGAIRVMLADNLDNADPERPDFPGRERLMAEKYIPARAILETALRKAEAARAEWRRASETAEWR
jgi:(p)ppGpp synthase/HD superfamily hydrolase